MDKATKKLLGLLDSPENLRRCAGVIAIGELAPKDVAVVKRLGEALDGANPVLAACILDTFDAIGSSAAAPYVMPLLNAEDAQTKLRAIGIVSKAGGNIVPHVRKELDGAGRGQKVVLADLLARIRTRDAFKALLELLFDRDFQVVKETCDAVQRHAAGATPAQCTQMHQAISTFMKTARVQSLERVLTSCLLLLGHIGRSEARTVLMRHAAPKYSPYVRRHAMLGLKGLDYTTATATTVAQALFQYTKEHDNDVVRQALDTLRKLSLDGLPIAQWDRLLKSPNADVRVFAVHRVASKDTVANNTRLVQLLKHDDTEVVETAAGALSAHEKATPLLLDALRKAKDDDAAWRLAKILKPHGERIKAAQLKPFKAALSRDLASGSQRAEALLYFLRNIDVAAADKALLEVGMAHKKAKRWTEAVTCLKRLTRSPAFTDENSFALAVCDLHLSQKEIAPNLRTEDHALRGFQMLARNRFPIFAAMKKDRSLGAPEFYYVGFHFSETPEPGRSFGLALLTHAAKTWPRSKEGKDAAVKAGLKKPRRAKKAPVKKKPASKKKAPAKKKAGTKKKPAKKKAAGTASKKKTAKQK